MNTADIIQSHSVLVPFKGSRDYIQGPDLVETALGFLERFSITRARFSSHSFIKTSSCLVNIREQGSDDVVPFRGQIETDQGTYCVQIGPDPSAQQEDARVPFDEGKVTNFCQISDDLVSLKGPLPFSLTETIVSMKKALLEARYQDAVGKWIFTSVDYKIRPKKVEKLSVKIDHNFQHKLVKSSVLADGNKIALLYFSLAGP